MCSWDDPLDLKNEKYLVCDFLAGLSPSCYYPVVFLLERLSLDDKLQLLNPEALYLLPHTSHPLGSLPSQGHRAQPAPSPNKQPCFTSENLPASPPEKGDVRRVTGE